MKDEKKQEPMQAEVVKAETLPAKVVDTATIVALQKADIDQQVATARAFPRDITSFKAHCLSMATLDQETADSMYYQLPRDGKLLEGPSIRLAEIAASCWGNVRYGARVIEVGDTYLTARGVCHDLERNTYMEIDVRRRIVNKYGKRYNDDMIQTTGLAACAIALRNAVFKVVPAAYIKPVLEAAKRVAAGDEKTLAARRDAALLYFKEKGVKADYVYALLGVKGKEDVGLEHISKLVGVRNAIKDGETTVEELFGEFITGGTKATVTPDSLTKGADVTGKDDAKKPETPQDKLFGGAA
jgi:hypothetical protein